MIILFDRYSRSIGSSLTKLQIVDYMTFSVRVLRVQLQYVLTIDRAEGKYLLHYTVNTYCYNDGPIE
jgi:hypothetical protein